MALAPNEVRSGGYVVDKATVQPVVTTSATGARWNGGNKVDADGRLIVRG